MAGLQRPREELYERVAQRVDEMLRRGLIGEVRRLEERGIGPTARQALGYKQILDAGPDASAEQVRDDIVRATKRFARRQLSWFNADPRVVWFDTSAPGLVDSLSAFFTAEGALP
jgi:tRNA dimethylallyltransferase